VDPDSHGSALIWVFAGSGSGSRRAKMNYKYRKKLRIFMFWSAGCSFLKAEGFSCSFCVLYGGLRINKLQFFIKQYPIFFSCYFFKFLVNKTLDSELDPDPQLGKRLDPDPHWINADPQPWKKNSWLGGGGGVDLL
jgi:hypothetical protein